MRVWRVWFGVGMRFRLLWVAVAALAVVGAAAVVVGAESDSFDDDGGVHEPSINRLSEAGVLEGTECGERRVCPDDPLLRWVMAVWVTRALDQAPEGSEVETRFADVDPAVWWVGYVERLADLGVTSGCKTGPLRYCPDQPVTRAQMATFLVRALDLEAAPAAGFADTGGNTHEANIDALAAAGVTSGCRTGPLRYCPDQSVTRAQMATFLVRALDLVQMAPVAGEGLVVLLDGLSVEVEQPDGYDRDLFRHWIDADGDGCDTRREVLIAEAVTAPTVGGGCALSGGVWVSRYDALTETGSGRGFDIDHLVPLKEAWESGAHSWDSQQRERFANDLGYEHSLVGVSAGSNRSKGAQDPTTWLPPEASQRCWYAAAWINVKVRWELSVDTAEADTLRDIISDCPDDAADASLPAPAVTTTTATSTPEQGCHPDYSPCIPYLEGDALNCGDLTTAQKPVTVLVAGVDPYRLDRDGDGQGCTS